MKSSSRAGLRARLTALSCAAFLSFSAAVFYLINSSINTLKQEKGREMNSAGVMMLNQMGQLVLNQLDHISSIGRRPEIITALNRRHSHQNLSTAPVSTEEVNLHHNQQINAELSRLLKTEIESNDVSLLNRQIFSEITLTDRYGHVIATTDKSSRSDYRNQHWWQRTVDESQLVSELYHSTEGRKKGISLSVRINDDKGNMAGIIQAVLSEQWLAHEATITTSLRPSNEVRLANREGQLLYSSRPYIYLENIKSKDYFKLLQHEVKTGEVTEGGKRKLYVVATHNNAPATGSLGWTMFIADDLDIVLADTYELANQMVTTFLIILGIFIIMAIILMKTIIKPVLALRKAAIAVAEGNFDLKISVTSKDEIGDLEQAFNEMAFRLKTSYNQLEKEANTDELTGLANRRHFFQRATQVWESAIRYQRPLSIIAIDFDHFKKVNDLYGHDAGDAVLQCTSRLIQQQCRNTDIFGRLGGEEFALVLVETDSASAHKFAERIRQLVAINTVSTAENNDLNITLSLGVASYRPGSDIEQGALFEDLLKQADKALYTAKNNGRNQVIRYPDYSCPHHSCTDRNHPDYNASSPAFCSTSSSQFGTKHQQ